MIAGLTREISALSRSAEALPDRDARRDDREDAETRGGLKQTLEAAGAAAIPINRLFRDARSSRWARPKDQRGIVCDVRERRPPSVPSSRPTTSSGRRID